MQYTDIEANINRKLVVLFDEWRETIQSNGLCCDDFVADGLYPYFSEQNKKILFIGRESLGLSGCDYIEALYDDYKKGRIDDDSINSYKFHSLMFYLSWAINNSFPDWKTIPYASELADQFAIQGGFSFAFMNLSKFSNESDSWQADWALIDSFIDVSKHPTKNFFNEQIRLVNPDIIITMNLQGRLQALGSLDVIDHTSNANICCYLLSVDGKKIPLYDMFHFSAPNKKGDGNYYTPLKTAMTDGDLR